MLSWDAFNISNRLGEYAAEYLNWQMNGEVRDEDKMVFVAVCGI